jgi:5-methylcytosine-specific restriction endonuclease McrA
MKNIMTKLTKKELKKLEKKETKRLLEVWKEEGKAKWGNKCEVCGKTKYIQGHHFFAFHKYKELRFDIFNFVPLCRGCHFSLERTKKMDIAYKIIVYRGIKWLNKLLKKI